MALVFDDRNLLPEGVHDATPDEIAAAFGGTACATGCGSTCGT